MSLNAIAASVMSAPSASFDAARQRKDDKVRDALSALQTLQTRTTDAREEKKAAARQKVEQLKARIQSLRMTMVGNPEALAKMAAQLARELGAAVKAYAAAGGSTAGMSAPSAPVAAAPTATVAEAAPAEPERPTVGTGDAPLKTTGDEKAEAETSGDANTPTDPYREILERQQAQAAEQSRRNADQEADGKFAADVKSLVNDLKAVLRKAAEEARRKGDTTESPDQKAASEALNEIQDALSEMAPPMIGVAVSVQI